MSIRKNRNKREVLTLYRDYLMSKVSQVRILGEAQQRDLKNVFVELTIADRPSRHEDSEFVRMMNDSMRRRYDPFRSQTQKESLELSRHSANKRRVAPDELVRQGTKAIIIGPPGCGKTTLLKYVALQADKDGRLVIWLELKGINKLFFAQAEKVAIEEGHFLLQELWVSSLKTHLSLVEAELNFLREHWQAELKANRLVVLLDGFDELQEEGIEQGVNRCVSELTSSFRDNIVLISTRPYALRKLGSERLEEFEVEPLNHRQIESFLTAYYPNDPAASGLLIKLRGRSSLRDLLRVPLLLGVVLRLYKENRFADQPLKLYEAIVTDLVHELDRSKSVFRQFRVSDARMRLGFLRFLAFEQLLRDPSDGEESQSTRVLFSYDRLKQKAQEFSLRGGYSHTPSDLVEDALASPLLSEFGPETFAFTHLTLQEYLAASEFAVFHQKNEFEGLRIFCRAYFDPKIAEMEVLPMTLAASAKSNSLYEELEGLAEPFTFANFRLRARGLVYGATIDQERLRKLIESFVEFLWERRVESKPYLDLIASSLAGSPQCYLTPTADSLAQFLNQDTYDYMRAQTTDVLGRIGGEKARSLLETTVLSDKAGFVRQKAAYWLGEIRDPKSTPALATALKDEDGEVVKAAARAIVRVSFKEGMQALLDLLQTGNTVSRSSAVFWLGVYGRGITLDLIEGILADEEGEVRLKALEALGFVGGERSLSILCNSKICATTVTAVGHYGGERAISFLLNALENTFGFVRCAAIDALAKIDAKRFTEVFIERLRDPDWYARQRAAVALDLAADRRAIPALLSALDYNSHLDLISSHRGGVVGAAAHALRHFRDEEVFQSLLNLLTDHMGGHGTESAALALGRLGDTRAIGPLLDIFENARNIDWAAAEALGLIADKSATLQLITALGEGGDGIVQMRAAEALGIIKDDRAVIPLVMALKDQSAGEEAALALRNFDASVLAEELPKAFTHEDCFVRRKAVTYAPYYCVDSGLVTAFSRMAESDPDDLVRRAAGEAKTMFIRKLENLANSDRSIGLPSSDTELTRQTLNAVLRCNKASKLQGSEEIFKSTNQAQEALVMLPGIVVRDESSLRDFITYLYMLIYEGAGDQKLRFLKDNGGPMERDECDAVWNLKALRNKWLIHDPEHGDSKSIDRSYRTLAEGLNNLGLNKYPSKKEEFEDLQHKVLSTLLDFHTELERRIAGL